LNDGEGIGKSVAEVEFTGSTLSRKRLKSLDDESRRLEWCKPSSIVRHVTGTELIHLSHHKTVDFSRVISHNESVNPFVIIRAHVATIHGDKGLSRSKDLGRK
jgi:hypothetical protein